MDNNVNEVKEKEEYSLNDDRRVKVLSPGAMVAKRFFRNRLAVIGLIMLLAMFIFSFIGGLVSPYGQDEQFFTTQQQQKEYVGVTQNDDLRYTVADGQEFSGILQAQFLLAQGRGETSCTYDDVTYDIVEDGTDLYAIYSGDTLLAIAAKDIITEEEGTLSFNVKYEALRAYANGETSFSADGANYELDEDGNILTDGAVVGYISRFVVRAQENGVVITRDFTEALEQAIETDDPEFIYTGEDGVEYTYEITYNASSLTWSVLQTRDTYVYDRYAEPSK